MEGLAVAAYRFGTYGLVVAALMAARRHRIGWKVMRASMAGHRARLRCRTVLLGGEADHHRQRNRDRRPATDRCRHRGEPGFGEVIRSRDMARIGRHRRRRDRRAQRRLRRTDRLARRPPRRRALFAWSAYFVSPSGRRMSSPPTTTPSAPRSGWRSSTHRLLLFGQSLAWPHSKAGVGCY